MTFRADCVDQFKLIFSETATLISSSIGCHGVDLMQDAGNETVFFTLSKWESEGHLNLYRSSELFKTTWGKVKPLFSEKAEAWSLTNTTPTS